MQTSDYYWIAGAVVASVIIVIIAAWWLLVERRDRAAEREYQPPRHRRRDLMTEREGWTDQQLRDLAAADFSLWDLEMRAHLAGAEGDAALIRAQWVDEVLRKISRGEA